MARSLADVRCPRPGVRLYSLIGNIVLAPIWPRHSWAGSLISGKCRQLPQPNAKSRWAKQLRQIVSGEHKIRLSDKIGNIRRLNKMRFHGLIEIVLAAIWETRLPLTIQERI